TGRSGPEAGEAVEAGPGDLAGGSSGGGTDLGAADLEGEGRLGDVAGPAGGEMGGPDEADPGGEGALDLEGPGELASAGGDEAGGGVDLEDDGADTAAEDLDDALADGELAEAAGTPGLTASAGIPVPVTIGEAAPEQAGRPRPGAVEGEEEAFVYGDDD